MKCVSLFKNGGFYSVYGNDTYIFHYLFNYKIIDNRTSFPISVYDKVTSKLKDNSISYVNKCTEDIVDFKKKNRYDEFLELGKCKYSFSHKIDVLLSKLDKLSEKDIDDIIDFIDMRINEK